MSFILVGVDGSPAGDAALHWSLREAVRSGAGVTAVRAWQSAEYADGAGLSGWVLSDEGTQEALDACVKKMRERSGADGVDVRTRVVTGPAALVLAQEAEGADLLVVGRRHESALARAVLGSVSSAALHHAPCPVVVVPPGWSGDEAAGAVVVGVDESAASVAALAWSVRRAARDHCRLVPVRVRGAFEDAVHAPDGVPDLPEHEGAELSRLERMAQQVAGGSAVDIAPQIRVGHAGRELLARAERGDVLVVGSRRRGHLMGWLLGSTSATVVHSAPVPVVVVREDPESITSTP